MKVERTVHCVIPGWGFGTTMFVMDDLGNAVQLKAGPGGSDGTINQFAHFLVGMGNNH